MAPDSLAKLNIISEVILYNEVWILKRSVILVNLFVSATLRNKE